MESWVRRYGCELWVRMTPAFRSLQAWWLYDSVVKLARCSVGYMYTCTICLTILKQTHHSHLSNNNIKRRTAYTEQTTTTIIQLTLCVLKVTTQPTTHCLSSHNTLAHTHTHQHYITHYITINHTHTLTMLSLIHNQNSAICSYTSYTTNLTSNTHAKSKLTTIN